MPANFRRFLLIPSVILLLSACGVKPTTLAPNNSPIPPAAVPTETPLSPPTAKPATEPTTGPTSPLPGLVYGKLGANVEYQGLWIVQTNGQSKEISTKANPKLSPDQKQVLYNENSEIWLMDLATGKTRNLTGPNNRVGADYQWWPAQPGIIVFHYQPVNDIKPMAGYLATVKTDGTNTVVIDEEIGSNSPAALSSDGETIAYDRAGEPWVYNLRGGNMPILLKYFPEKFRIAANPAWSPDGRKIAWQLFGDQSGTEGWSAVALLDLDTFKVTLLHRYTLLGGGDIGKYHLAWSPDGKWLAVVNQAERAEDVKVSLWVMTSDGSEEHYLGAGERPVWSPDGKTMVFLAKDGVSGVKAGDWNPFPVTLPAGALVIDWVAVN